jgi:hypothetical protein
VTFVPDPSWPSIVDLARELWGELTDIRNDEIRFGNKQGQKVIPSKNLWHDFDSGEKGGYVKLWQKARPGERLPPRIDGLGTKANGNRTGHVPRWEDIRETYDYPGTSADPRLIQVVRTKSGKPRFRQRQRLGDGKWKWHVDDIPDHDRRLYRLSDLRAAPHDETIWICAGEKDADRLHNAGLTAITNIGGEGMWRDECAEEFRGRSCIVLQDNDDTGRRHTAAVASSLYGIATSVKVLLLPKLPPKGDVSDWLDVGNTVDELQRLAREAPAETGNTDQQIDHDLVNALSVHAWIDREVQPTRRMLGEVVIQAVRMFLVGQTGIGKTLFAYAMAAAMAAGRKFVHWECDGPVRVLIIDGEMSERLIQRRAEVLLNHQRNIPPDSLMIYSMQLAEEFARRFPQLGPPAPLNEEKGREWLLHFIALVKPDVVILDNVMSLITGKQSDEEPWGLTLPLVLAITALGIAQVWLDHTGWVTSRQFGSSTKAWFFDVVGMLLRPEKIILSEHETCFDLSFEPPGGKARNRCSENWNDYAPHHIRLTQDGWVSEKLVAAEAASRAEDRRLGKLDAEKRKLLRIIHNMLAEGLGEETSPQPEMAPVTALRRTLLRERCIREGWHYEHHVRTELEGKVASVASLTDRGLDREGKALTALEGKGIIRHDRRWVWLP